MFVRSHVERCLQEVFETCHVLQDDDGDYPFVCGTSACFVRVAHDGHDVHVVAIAADKLRSSCKLLTEINEINLSLRAARVQLAVRQLQVVQALPAIACTPDTLRLALDGVRSIAGDIGPMIAAVFDGVVPFETAAEKTANNQDESL
jgi:hypothetical protein